MMGRNKRVAGPDLFKKGKKKNLVIAIPKKSIAPY